jgi:FkbM family methyltransferase
LNRQHVFAQTILRSWPFPRGAGRILDRYFSNIRFDNQIEIVRTTDGFDISIEPNDLIGRHLYLTGEFDRSVVEVLCNFSEPRDVMLDIGANIGYVSACFLNNVPNSKVIAVEPQPAVLELLKINLGRFGRHEIYPFALGDMDGEVSFDVDSENKGASRVTNNGMMKVQMRSAERIFQDLKIDKLDIVKIDAEGSEETILRSCASHLERLQPRVILFEDLGHGGATKILSDIGYRIFGIKKSLQNLRLALISNELQLTYHDYVAISEKRALPSTAQKLYGC